MESAKGDQKLVMLMNAIQHACKALTVGRGDDTVGNPPRARMSQFELFEFILLLKFGKRFPVERFEATVSQSTAPSPPLPKGAEGVPENTIYIYIYTQMYIVIYIYIFILIQIM